LSETDEPLCLNAFARTRRTCFNARVISYSTDPSGLNEADLTGFFVGWPKPPSPAQHLAVLRGSYRVVIARSGGEVVGFVNMISDGVLTAFIPWLEVRPSFQGRGIGTELVRRVVAEAAHLYSIDLTCDDALRPYYERLGMSALTGMGLRNRDAI
jgi:ribosomal protein S18 acetylase RimI-like enzyme